MALYIHLSGAPDPSHSVVESVKLPILKQLTTAENLKAQLLDYLTLERNDGNKSYSIEAIKNVDGLLEGEIQLANGDDLFVSISVSVDA